ncbi:UvrY/SirA/GacA family response regulator transcription factor [Marinagarivorans algicola]|uniref:UvrY/SirA/GacA family response regulator transcription factor n=1 Tax=Marinagarivorans algicola TaxID=1513270 RepID=UPI0006B6507C|nr:UvrY/SirA/GacA family response regulator transcription factor [Marinagarivorans algicola]
MTKILVADDHDLVRMGIMRMLADVNGFEVVGEAKSGEEAVSKARLLPVDVILMDVRMPGFGGLEATRKILAHNPEIKIIVVTSLTDDMFPERLMRAGASGYVTKGASFDEIVNAVQKVVKGQLYMASSVAQQIALRNFTGGTKQSPFEMLSERELQTATMIANGNKVHSIADSFSVSPKTINSYRYRIFEKLDVNSDVELTILAIKHKILDIETMDSED